MTQYQYKVVPAPAKGEKARGVKAAENRFALAIERLMNEMAADGWEFQRAELLPSEERSGLTSSQTVWRNLLVFRRPASVSTIETPAPAEPAAAEPLDTEDDANLEGRKLASAADLAAPAALAATAPSEPEEPEEPYPAAEETAGETEPASDTAEEDEDDETPLDGPSSLLTERAARMRQD